jgi:hypothetical protein
MTDDVSTGPLIINYNIFDGKNSVSPEVSTIARSKEAIEINQDALGKTAVRIDGSRSWSIMQDRLTLADRTWSSGEVLAKPLANGDVAVLMFNRLASNITMQLDFSDVGNTSMRCWHVRDIWQERDMGRFNLSFSTGVVPSHGCRFLRLSAPSACVKIRPPAPTPCPKPPSVAAFSSRERGWYPGECHECGPTCPWRKGVRSGCKGSHINVQACAAACVAAGSDCAAFHVYMGKDHTCKAGDCWLHGLPLGSFVPHSHSFAYTKNNITSW